MSVTYTVSHFVSRQKCKDICPQPTLSFTHIWSSSSQFLFFIEDAVEIFSSAPATDGRNSRLKPRTRSSCIIQYKKRSASPCPVHNSPAGSTLRTQGLAILARQVPHVAKWWWWCKRKVTAFETWHVSNNGDNVFCAEEVHLPEGNMYCVSRHRRWEMLQSFGCQVARVCSPGCPLFLSSLAAG